MRERKFEQLVEESHQAVFAYARSMTGSDTLAEDAVQETFLRAWRYLDSFRGQGSFEGWLIRICRHCVYDLAVRESRAEVITLEPRFTEPDNRPEVLLVLDSLSMEHREVLVICGVLGYDYQTAAIVLDLPVGTVRSRLHRGRAALAAALEQENMEVG